MSELNQVIETRLSNVESGVASAASGLSDAETTLTGLTAAVATAPVITVSDTAPSSPKAGDLWITTAGAPSIYSGTAWALITVTV